MPTFTTPDVVVRHIQDGATVFTVGMTLISASETILEAIETSFLRTGHPRGLTLVHASGQSDRQRGIQHLAHEGLVTRIIGSHWGLAPRWMDLISGNAIAANCLPQGQMTHWLRSIASGLPGHLTQIGLGTFIDPEQEGGKMNDLARALPDLIHRVTVRGQTYLWIDAVPLDWALVRGTTADDAGNVSAEHEAMKLEVLPAVFSVRRYNGRVAVQVEQRVPRGTINPRHVEVPGVHVDFLVQADNPEVQHRQTSSWYFDPAFSSEGWRAANRDSMVGPLDVRRVIGRRAVLELTPGAVVNMGTGIPNDVIGPEVLKEQADDLVTLTVESGVYGGRPVGGIDFGIAKNPDALIEHPYQFDFYNGHGVDVTFMGFGEVDEAGRVNATKMGPRATGAGGFIDITQPARKVVFCGTFSAQGLVVKIDPVARQLQVVEEGRISKWVTRVQQVSFDGHGGRLRGQQAVIVTERAVFRLQETGWELTEVAPGIDLEADVLSRMAFRPHVSEHLTTMDSRIFSEEELGLAVRLKAMGDEPGQPEAGDPGPIR